MRSAIMLWKRYLSVLVLALFPMICHAQIYTKNISTSITWPVGTLSCTQTYTTGVDETWDNYVFTDSNGIAHNFNGETSCGLAGPRPTPISTIQVNSTDGLYSLTARGSSGTLKRLNSAYPKFQVLNVSYAPPGPASSTDYKTQTQAGVTTTVANSFSYKINLGVTVYVDSYSADYTHATSSTTEESTTKTVTYDISTKNTNNFVNHDYDQFDIWLNPKVDFVYSSDTSATWSSNVNSLDKYLPLINGQPQMDHITILAGWLNGNIPWPANVDYQTRLQRSWDSSISNPGLTIADYAAILALDPFAQQIDPVSGAKLPLATNAQIYTRVQIPNNPRYTMLRNVNYTAAMQTVSISSVAGPS